MEYGPLVIMVCIVGYGIYEYRRRERLHREWMESLRNGGALPVAAAGPPWRLFTTGAVGVILLAAAGYLAYRGFTLPRYGPGLAVIGGIFALIALPVFWMLIRDCRAYRDHRTPQ